MQPLLSLLTSLHESIYRRWAVLWVSISCCLFFLAAHTLTRTLKQLRRWGWLLLKTCSDVAVTAWTTMTSSLSAVLPLADWRHRHEHPARDWRRSHQNCQKFHDQDPQCRYRWGYVLVLAFQTDNILHPLVFLQSLILKAKIASVFVYLFLRQSTEPSWQQWHASSTWN